MSAGWTTSPMWFLELRLALKSHRLFWLTLAGGLAYASVILFFWPQPQLSSAEVLKGRSLFWLASTVLLGLLLLVAAGYGAAILASERDRARVDFLRMSGVGVTGVLVPRACASMSAVFFMTLTTLPAASILTLAGAIQPGEIVLVYLVLTLSVLGGLALGFLNGSLWRRSDHGVVGALFGVLMWNIPWLQGLWASPGPTRWRSSWICPMGALQAVHADVAGGGGFYRFAALIICMVVVSGAVVTIRYGMRFDKGAWAGEEPLVVRSRYSVAWVGLGWNSRGRWILDCAFVVGLFGMGVGVCSLRSPTGVLEAGDLIRMVFVLILLVLPVRIVGLFAGDVGSGLWDRLKMSGGTVGSYFRARLAGAFLWGVLQWGVLVGLLLIALEVGIAQGLVNDAVLMVSSVLIYLLGAYVFVVGLSVWGGVSSVVQTKGLMGVYVVLGIWGADGLSGKHGASLFHGAVAAFGRTDLSLQWYEAHYPPLFGAVSCLGGLLLLGLAFMSVRRKWNAEG